MLCFFLKKGVYCFFPVKIEYIAITFRAWCKLEVYLYCKLEVPVAAFVA